MAGKDIGELCLYYDHPANIWEETLPIGNGRLGGMIWGGIGEELIGLNEESLWSGYEREKNNPRAFDSLSKVRELIFEGRNAEAESLIQENMLGEYNESYLPLGNLHLTYRDLSWQNVQNYKRCLDLDAAVATVDFDVERVHFHREVFASYPGKAIAVRLVSDRPVMQVVVWLESELKCVFTEEKNALQFAGQCPEHLDPSYPNLWDAHEPFQIDGNFGGIAGIANMLVQDRGDRVKVLPALPGQFSDGYVKGLRIKGNKRIDIVWRDGRLVRSEIWEEKSDALNS